MNTGARITVFRANDFACIRIIGRANFTSSIDFKTLVTELNDRGTLLFVLDLSQCPLMDSTFLGVLSGLGLKMSGNAPEPSRIELLNPNQRILDLLETLGVLHLFRVVHGAVPCPDGHIEHEQPPATPSRKDLSQTCLEAHKTLMDINPQNVERFKDVARFLDEEIQKP